MATNLVRVGTERQVNLAATGGDQLLPDVAALTDGRFMVVFQNTPLTTVTTLRFVNADGTLSTGPVTIPTSGPDPAVAARSGGGAVVVWESVTASPDIELAVVNAQGTAAGKLTVWDDALSNRNPDVATFANGKSIVVWERQVNDADIVARVLEGNGTTFTTTDRIPIDISGGPAPGPQTFSAAPAVAASGNKALIAYEDERGGGNGDIRAKIFDVVTGSFTANPILIADKSVSLGRVDVAALTDGRYVVVYEELDAGNVFARFVSAAGSPVGPEIVVANSAADEDNARVAGLPDGGFVVTWVKTSPVTGNDVFARRFLSDGTPGGDTFRLNSAADAAQVFPAIAVNSKGRAFIAFHDNGFRPGDDDPTGIRGGAFQMMTEVINGTLGPDKITTYNLGETINGGPGNDVIHAMGGNDIVFGGDHNDTINGGSGNDNLKGERGADIVNGGSGNDWLDGGQKKGTLTGGPGLDSFVFNTAVKKGNKQKITDFRPADDTIVLDASKFKKLKPGPLKGKNFFKGSPEDGNDYVGIKGKKVIYDKNGDQDGGATVIFVLADGSKGVGKDDFLVVA